MKRKQHRYRTALRWTGDRGSGTASYTAYGRSYDLFAPGKSPIGGSADPAFRGDARRWNPEDLLVASLSACHQLWYLHLCASAGVVVLGYEDEAEGIMVEEPGGAGQFSLITLRPCVTLAPGSDASRAMALHEEAGAMCFIQRSLTCPVVHDPSVTVANGDNRSAHEKERD